MEDYHVLRIGKADLENLSLLPHFSQQMAHMTLSLLHKRLRCISFIRLFGVEWERPNLIELYFSLLYKSFVCTSSYSHLRAKRVKVPSDTAANSSTPLCLLWSLDEAVGHWVTVVCVTPE